MSDASKELYDILNDFSDYLSGGIKREHPPLAAKSPAFPEEREEALERLSEEICHCTGCPLHLRRQKAVPGEGVLDPRVMIIGEGPGAEEDRTGKPFVGRAGQYLDKWLKALDLSRRENVYIGNVVKCRPPNNRDPLPEESAACNHFLIRQLDIIKPLAILAVGRIASQILLNSDFGIGQLRGKVYTYRSIPLVPTYHPSGVLRNPSLRGAVWEDLQLLKTVFHNE